MMLSIILWLLGIIISVIIGIPKLRRLTIRRVVKAFQCVVNSLEYINDDKPSKNTSNNTTKPMNKDLPSSQVKTTILDIGDLSIELRYHSDIDLTQYPEAIKTSPRCKKCGVDLITVSRGVPQFQKWECPGCGRFFSVNEIRRAEAIACSKFKDSIK